MPSFASLTAALAFAGAALSTPVQLNKRGFSVHQVERATVLKNGPAQIVKTLRKYGKPVPQHLLDAAANRADVFSIEAANGSAPAVPGDEYDSLYLSPVTIGDSAPTTVQLDFDTGSADLWVFSSLQASSQLAGHDYYKVDAAKEMKGSSWKITYGDNSGAAGKVYADKVVVGGVTATSQAVEAATSVSTQFTQDVNTDGLLGLAFSTLNTVKPQQQTTFTETVLSQLPKPLFAVDLKYHAAGTYDFGFIDSSKYTGQLTYINADNSQGFWGFSASAYSVGTVSTKATITGILDTGTTLIYTDTAIVKAYYAKVKGAKLDSTQGGYTFPCSTTTPDFSITVGGVKQTVPGKHINYAPISKGSTTCFGGIQTDDGIGFSIFGDIFLKSKYIVHELGATPRLGFGQQPSV